MIHLKNHFDGSGTYIIGKLIHNGCQTFPIEELERVCQEYDVPKELEEQVRQLYYENLKTPEDWDILVNDGNWRVRASVAKQGYGLDILIKDEHWEVRATVAEQGYGLDKLINDEDWTVRAAAKNYTPKK